VGRAEDKRKSAFERGRGFSCKGRTAVSREKAMSL
jgi:hypothetical protein